jgi:hypothetical protein
VSALFHHFHRPKRLRRNKENNWPQRRNKGSEPARQNQSKRVERDRLGMIVVRANDRRPTALRPNRGNRIEVRVNQTMGMNMLKGSAKESQQKCQTSL